MNRLLNVVSDLSECPGVCIGLSCVFFLMYLLTAFGLLDALLKMHRSKSAVKKIKKEYSFMQKLRLLPFEDHCLHAVRFCKGLIWFSRVRYIFFALYILIALVGIFYPVSEMLPWVTITMILCFDIPMLLLSACLSRPLIGRFKEFSFEKYHNTQDHFSLL